MLNFDFFPSNLNKKRSTCTTLNNAQFTQKQENWEIRKKEKGEKNYFYYLK